MWPTSNWCFIAGINIIHADICIKILKCLILLNNIVYILSLQAIHSLKGNTNGQRMNLKFLKYAQSSQCNNMNDSSVSYASASLVLE